MKKKPKPKRTVLDMPYDRKELAVAVLFKAGFAMWEVAALLRWSAHTVHDVIRKRL